MYCLKKKRLKKKQIIKQNMLHLLFINIST